jgi:hypothetical protein
MRLVDLLWYLPLAVAISVVMGASGRHGPREIAVAAARTFRTLFLVVAGVAVAIRLLVIGFA